MIKNFKTASITELRQNATVLISGLNKSKEPVFILQNSRKAAVLIDDETFQELISVYNEKYQMRSEVGTSPEERLDVEVSKPVNIINDSVVVYSVADSRLPK